MARIETTKKICPERVWLEIVRDNQAMLRNIIEALDDEVGSFMHDRSCPQWTDVGDQQRLREDLSTVFRYIFGEVEFEIRRKKFEAHTRVRGSEFERSDKIGGEVLP